MAPVPLMGGLSAAAWYSSPALAVLSTVVFLALSIMLLALCMRCRRNPENGYDVNTGSNGKQDVHDGTSAANPAFTTWRNHDSMPNSSLERAHTTAN